MVEGYTDVMACHLAGVDTAIATCGTAFGSDHITILRRIMRDEAEVTPAEVIFTFDGDAAGQKAAMRAFAEDQRFVSQTYVAVEPNGMDPCELRQEKGDAAVRDLIAGRLPLFEFAVRTTINRFDLDSVPGRMQALRAAAPVVAGIRDRALRPEYARRLAGLLGMPVETVQQAVAAAGREAARATDLAPYAECRPRSRAPADRLAGPSRRSAPRRRRSRASRADPRAAAAADAQPARPGRRPRAPAAPGRAAGADRLDAAEFDALGDEAFGDAGLPGGAPGDPGGRRAGRRGPDPAGGLGRAGRCGRHRAGPAVRHRAGRRPAAGAQRGRAWPGWRLSLQVEIAGRDLLRQEAEVHSRMQRLDAAGDAIGFRAALVEAEAIVRRRTALRDPVARSDAASD